MHGCPSRYRTAWSNIALSCSDMLGPPSDASKCAESIRDGVEHVRAGNRVLYLALDLSGNVEQGVGRRPSVQRRAQSVDLADEQAKRLLRDVRARPLDPGVEDRLVQGHRRTSPASRCNDSKIACSAAIHFWSPAF